MRNTADVRAGEPIIWSQSDLISGVSGDNSLFAFNDIHGINGEVLFFRSDPSGSTLHETRTQNNNKKTAIALIISKVYDGYYTYSTSHVYNCLHDFT
jgi:hypothetical protein